MIVLNPQHLSVSARDPTRSRKATDVALQSCSRSPDLIGELAKRHVAAFPHEPKNRLLALDRMRHFRLGKACNGIQCGIAHACEPQASCQTWLKNGLRAATWG